MPLRSLFICAGMIGIIAMGAASAYAKSISTDDFVQNASVANEFEIESSNLALQKSQNSEVKSFAHHMVDDHTNTGEKLKEALKDAHIKAQPAETLDDKHQDLLDKLDEASGSDFDRQYVSMQTDAHKEAVSLFGDYAKHGKNSTLRNFARQTLPTLKDHLKHVEQIKVSR